MGLSVRNGFLYFTPTERLRGALVAESSGPLPSILSLHALVRREALALTDHFFREGDSLDPKRFLQGIESFHNHVGGLLWKLDTPPTKALRDQEAGLHQDALRLCQPVPDLLAADEWVKRYAHETRLRLSSRFLKAFMQFVLHEAKRTLKQGEERSSPAHLWGAFLRFLPRLPICLDWSYVDGDLDLTDLAAEMALVFQLTLPGENFWVLIPKQAQSTGQDSGGRQRPTGRSTTTSRNFEMMTVALRVQLKAQSLPHVTSIDGLAREAIIAAPDLHRKTLLTVVEDVSPIDFKLASISP